MGVISQNSCRKMKLPAASSGVSVRKQVFSFAASGGELTPKRLDKMVSTRRTPSWSRCDGQGSGMRDLLSQRNESLLYCHQFAWQPLPALLQVLLCPGDMENRIKEQQLWLFADRTSCREFLANQFRLLLPSALRLVTTSWTFVNENSSLWERDENEHSNYRWNCRSFIGTNPLVLSAPVVPTSGGSAMTIYRVN